jgi:hypothetical protein
MKIKNAAQQFVVQKTAPQQLSSENINGLTVKKVLWSIHSPSQKFSHYESTCLQYCEWNLALSDHNKKLHLPPYISPVSTRLLQPVGESSGLGVKNFLASGWHKNNKIREQSSSCKGCGWDVNREMSVKVH